MSFIKRDLSDHHYILLSSLYGRDLGGILYFKWKHYLDPQFRFLKNRKKAILYEEKNRDLGIFVASKYKFYLNKECLDVSLQGDLGISCSIRSRSVLINFFHEIHDRECDLEMCFSDDRKIQTYEMIYKRYFTKNTEVINYSELTLSSNQMVRCDEFDKLNIENIPFENTLGRKRDLQYINYLEANPLYKKVRYITDGKFYAVIGESESCCEILDLSSPTIEGFSWAIKATMAFSSYCKVLVRKEHVKAITSLTNSTIFYSKSINLLLGIHMNKEIDTKNLWVGRIDRR